MKKLNTIFSFVLLSFCLFINVSNAEIIEPNVSYTVNVNSYDYRTGRGDNLWSEIDNVYPGYKDKLINGYLNTSTREEYITWFNDFRDYIYSTYNFNSYFICYIGSMYHIYFYNNSSIDFAINTLSVSELSNATQIFINAGVGDRLLYINGQATSASTYNYNFTSDIFWELTGTYVKFNPNYIFEYNSSIKYMTYGSYWTWDGTSYFYKAPSSDEPDTPTMPTNAEIASAVQMFYNSDLYKNNTNFKDFMVVYSFTTGYYSFIGTDNHLLQEIYYDGAKPSNDDFTYPETWWRFYNYLGNIQNLFYGSNYWLYSTLKVDDVLSPIKYDGVGKLNNLFNLKFTNQSVIVYSSYEYEVYEYWPPEIEGDSNKQEITTIPGDQYTYDETLDPTDSEYSPIQNYIPVNPSQTILGDVDFDEINKTFEENKDILNIEGASWLFTANNKLVGYFIGFLSLLIVFLIISRILGG